MEGSLAFAVVAFFCTYMPLVWGPSTGSGQIESVLIALTLALAVTLIEGVARRGRDNLFIPVGTYFILGALLDLDIPGLQRWLVIVVALVGLIVMRVGSTQRNACHYPAARIGVGWPAGRTDVRRKSSCA
jgi:phytol kinase